MPGTVKHLSQHHRDLQYDADDAADDEEIEAQARNPLRFSHNASAILLGEAKA
ncbi:hypothetical protein ACQZ6L_15125 [Agrobacterium fabrum]